MPRTNAEKKHARASAIGRQRKCEREQRVAEQAAELATVRAENAELRHELSTSRFNLYQKDTRIAELEAKLSLFTQGNARAIGQAQCSTAGLGLANAMVTQPHPSTVSLVSPGAQQFRHPMQQQQYQQFQHTQSHQTQQQTSVSTTVSIWSTFATTDTWVISSPRTSHFPFSKFRTSAISSSKSSKPPSLLASQNLKLSSFVLERGDVRE